VAMANARLQRLSKGMQDEGLDVLLVCSPPNVYYLTGFLTEPYERFMGAVVDGEGSVFLLVPELDGAKAREALPADHVFCYRDGDDPFESLGGIFSAFGLPRSARVGLEKSYVTLSVADGLRPALPDASFVDAGPLLASLRARKDPDEIEKIKAAVANVEKALMEGLECLKEGVTELEVAARIEWAMKVGGADGPAFSSAVLSGANSALPHGSPRDRVVREGELVIIDIGSKVQGYCSDITRTFLIGKAEHLELEMYEAVLAAHDAAVEAVRPGVAVGEVDRAAREVIEERGYGDRFIHRTGHGLGIEPHEEPSVGPGGQEVLEPGMVITIEPGIYIPGEGGVRIEDDVAVTEDGREVLSRFPSNLVPPGGD